MQSQTQEVNLVKKAVMPTAAVPPKRQVETVVVHLHLDPHMQGAVDQHHDMLKRIPDSVSRLNYELSSEPHSRGASTERNCYPHSDISSETNCYPHDYGGTTSPGFAHTEHRRHVDLWERMLVHYSSLRFNHEVTADVAFGVLHSQQ
eukprot:TRINITY_DN9336_c0_g7_i1.p1 TRINITY_DN9336_c0_g7~~TRINITY_DN9336_c0_g7_i1.p1  ORF type:complete len:147 (-),score=9.26 TRINITY_DN9336_c0_g7_i1:437-877(-)